MHATLLALGLILVLPALSLRSKRQCARTYHDSETKGSQAEGRVYCKEAGYDDLASFKTIDDFALATHELANRKDAKGAAFHTSGRWNGSHFVWLSLNISVGDPSSPYVPTYPMLSVYPVNEGSCLVLRASDYSTDLTWLVDQCTERHNFLCQYMRTVK